MTFDLKILMGVNDEQLLNMVVSKIMHVNSPSVVEALWGVFGTMV